MLDPARSLEDRLEAKAEVDEVGEEIVANRVDLGPEDESLLEKARSTRLR